MDTEFHMHAVWLGKNAKFTDPSYGYAGMDEELESLANEEHFKVNEGPIVELIVKSIVESAVESTVELNEDSKEYSTEDSNKDANEEPNVEPNVEPNLEPYVDNSRGPMLSARQRCAQHGYGRESVWPPFDPGRPHEEFKEEMRKRGALVGQWWTKLNHIVSGKELEIQEAILKLTDGDTTDEDGNTLTIEHFLERSWELARDTYNDEMPEPRNIESDFYLDPNGNITMTRSNDLDTFALDFSAAGQERERTTKKDRFYPLYRHGGNYRDLRPEFDEAMLSDDKFQTLKKPRPKPGPTQTNAYTFNQDVEGIQRKQRASLLVPHINLEDLTNPLYLLKFIYYRARFFPKAFVKRDSNRTYLGKTTRLLCGACDPHCFVHFEDFGPTPEVETPPTFQPVLMYKKEYAEMVAFNDRKKLYRLQSSGMLYGSMEAWLLMQTQVITYLFLTKFCQQMLNLAKEKEVDPYSSLSADERLKIKTMAKRGIDYLQAEHYPETWQDVDSTRQYELDSEGIEFKRYIGILATKKLDAEEHISRLFDEPDYFVNLIMEQKERHWTNIRNEYGSEDRGHHIRLYETDAVRHDLYLDCTRNVLRRAFFEFFIWNTISEALHDLESFYLKVINEAAPANSGNASTGNANPSLLMPCGGPLGTDQWDKRHREVQILVRHAAAFFVFEFRKRAIHAASQSTRDIWHINAFGGPNTKYLNKVHEYYDSQDIPLKIRDQTMKSERLQPSRMVAELIENFISNKSSSMYVGMRKTTSRILRHIEDCEGEDEEEKTFSGLIKTTLSGLNVLADIAEHLSLIKPHNLGRRRMTDKWELEHRRIYSDMLEKYSSYDILALGDCSLPHMPAKRRERVYRFLDEMQGYGKKPEESFGKAKTDIKRFGASILKTLIVPLNEGNVEHCCNKWGKLDPEDPKKPKKPEDKLKPVFQADDKVLERLRTHMGINENDWVFSNNEQPEDAQAQDSKEEREESKEIWLDLRKILSKRQKEYKNAWKKKLQGKQYVQTDQFDFIADEVSRFKAIDSIRKHRYEKGQQKRREKRRQRLQREKQLNSEPGYVDMRDAPLQQAAATAPTEKNTGDLGLDEDTEMPATGTEDLGAGENPVLPATGTGDLEAVEDLVLPAIGELQLEPQPQPVQQQPPDQTPPAQPQSPLVAPDGRPKGILNNHCWDAWRRVLVGDIRYTTRTGQRGKQKLPDIRWQAMEDAIKAIGFNVLPGGGSHHRYIHTAGCRWPESVASAFVINRPHGKGANRPIPDRQIVKWRGFLAHRNLTFDLVKAWYRQR
ncbi:Ff.00g104990.m01.CDS01 [Fusarium sp. VM40]|nr:Ff.00g104990.m01.CDS01 [Fusarium sp. VM40]